MTKALSILAGAAGAGALIWTARQVDLESVGGYWAEVALLAAAGLVLGLSRLPRLRAAGRMRLALVTLIVGFVPALVVSGWVLAAAQPESRWLERHVESWSDDIGVGWIVDGLSVHATVIAFALGLLLSFCFERQVERAPAAVPERAEAQPATAEPAEPALERREEQPEAEREKEPELTAGARDSK